jgi:uncharacterized protein
MKESRYNIWVERGDAAYVFSGISGALLRVPKDDYRDLQRFLSGEHGAACSAKLLEQMAIGRMLIPDDGDELALLAQRYEASRHDTSHFALTIVTSLGCNFDCPYCFEDKHASLMNAEVQRAVLQILDDQLPKIHSFGVSWFGGEPLLGKRALLALSDAFIERCDRAGVDYSAQITTNGFLLDEKTCSQLRDRRVQNAQVCLDGPPEVHDRMRPLANGKGTFWHIVRNLRHAIHYLAIAIRMNADTGNYHYAEELLRILAGEGLAGKLTVYLGQIVGVNDGVPAPSTTYIPLPILSNEGAALPSGRKPCCFTNREYARVEREFEALAARYGFSRPSLPRPVGAPCTAMRANELVVGSQGELYKCWESVGNPHEVIGNVRDYRNPNGRLQKWLKYDPFTNAECRGCIALPVCMGGCAHHAMDPLLYENRCGTFRHVYRERVLDFVEVAERAGDAGQALKVQPDRPMETR